MRIHSAASQVKNWSFSDRSSPRASKNELTVSYVRPFAAQITLPVRWSQTTVKYFWPFSYFASSIATATSPEARSTRPSASVATRTHIAFTARHETP